MAISVTTLGASNTPAGGATSLSITTSTNTAAGNQIYLAVCIDVDVIDNITDTAGNVYVQVAGSQSGVGAFLFNVFNNVRLANGGHITISLASGAAFNARMAAFAISGLSSGVMTGSSAGQGFGTQPIVALDNVAANNFAVGIICVDGPSSDGFTQDGNFTNPGNINTQTTTAVSAYAGYRQVPSAGTVIYQPTLGAARTFAALMVTLQP